MSLANRLSDVVPTRGRRNGCTTCNWIASLSDSDRAAFNQWIAEGRSITQLWEVAASDPHNPIEVGISAMRLHLRTCKTDES